MNGEFKTVLDAKTVAGCIKRLAHEIAEHDPQGSDIILLGIVRRGATIARRLRTILQDITGHEPAFGTLDISLYRDDHKAGSGPPRLLARDVPTALDGKRVVLVDDVLYTGRTVRAALDALTDLGRPAAIELAVLIDRGDRELPIRADYVGRNVTAPRGQRVYVRLSEVDGGDGVLLGAAQ